MDTSSSLPIALKRRWWWAVAAFALTVLCGYAAIYVAWHPSRASYWGIGASSALVYLLGYTRVYLPLNRPHPDGSILPQFGIGNRLTLFRGLLFGLLAGFLVLPPLTGMWAWIPGTLYTLASLTDLLDGRFARQRDETTHLGAKLDVEVDSLGIFIAFILGVKLGQLPDYFAVAGMLFYGYRLFIWVWTRLGHSTITPPPRSWRAIVGGFEVGFLCVMLFPVFTPPLTTVVGVSIMIPVLISFIWDGLITTGVVRVGSPWHRQLVARSTRWMRDYLPAALHVVLWGALAGLLLTGYPWTDLSAVGLLQHVLVIGLVFAAGFSSAGIGGWKSALVVLVTGAFLSLTAAISPFQMGITTAGFLLLLVSLGNRDNKLS